MNIKRFKTTLTAGILAASMILPGITAFAATPITGTDEVPVGTGAEAIEKIVKSPLGATYNETFTYTFTQTSDETDNSVKGGAVNRKNIEIPDVTVEAKDDDKTASASGNVVTNTLLGTIDLKNFTAEDTGVYIYTVTETTRTAGDPEGTTWSYDTAKYTLRVYVQKGADGELYKNITISDSEGKKLSKASFTNTLTKLSSFELTKSATDSDGLEPADQEYTFTVTIDRASLDTENANYQWSVDGETWTDFSSGETITLKSGQTATFKNVPTGSKVSVVESENIANVDYSKTTVNVEGSADSSENGGKTAVKVENVVVSEQNTDGAVTKISYSNTWKTLTVTGVVTDVAPYVTLVVVAVAAVAAYITIKRRIAM